MRDKKPQYYWDTNIFLHLIAGTTKDKDLLAGILHYAALVDQGDAILCTSVITEIEVHQSKLTERQKETFSQLFWRRNVVRYNVDPTVAKTAGIIRDYYSRRGNTLSMADVQHLATAIVLGVDEMHTTDGSGAGPHKAGKLLPLNGRVADAFNIVIREPRIQAPPLLASAGFETL